MEHQPEAANHLHSKALVGHVLRSLSGHLAVEQDYETASAPVSAILLSASNIICLYALVHSPPRCKRPRAHGMQIIDHNWRARKRSPPALQRCSAVFLELDPKRNLSRAIARILGGLWSDQHTKL